MNQWICKFIRFVNYLPHFFQLQLFGNQKKKKKRTRLNKSLPYHLRLLCVTQNSIINCLLCGHYPTIAWSKEGRHGRESKWGRQQLPWSRTNCSKSIALGFSSHNHCFCAPSDYTTSEYHWWNAISTKSLLLLSIDSLCTKLVNRFKCHDRSTFQLWPPLAICGIM